MSIFAAQAQAQKWAPLPYQKRGVKFLLSHSAAALFLRPGGRKTSIVLKAICELKRKKVPGRVLVIAPLRPCYRVWPEEVKKWEEFDHLRVEVLHGPGKDAALRRESDICVINPEGLDWLLGATASASFGGKKTKKVSAAAFKQLGFTTLVIDELTRFKHPSSQRFKMLKQVVSTFERRWGLTGSPSANGLLDLFGQCYVLDLGAALGQFVTRFKAEYFDQVGPNGWKLIPKQGASERIFARLAPLAFRLEDDEYPQLPPLTTNVISFDLPPAAQRVYDLLESDLLAKVGSRVVVAANAAAASGKCRQVASGAVYLDAETDAVGLTKLRRRAKREWAEVHNAKLDALEELADGLTGEPLLIGYEFRHDVERIRERLGDVPWIGGGVTPKQSAEIEVAWNSGDIPILLGHPQSMGHGLNLQAGGCSNVCWFTQTWDYELYDQFIRRVWRDGTTASRVTIHHLIARDTIEEVQLWSLKAKDRGQQALFNALAELAKKRGKS